MTAATLFVIAQIAVICLAAFLLIILLVGVTATLITFIGPPDDAFDIDLTYTENRGAQHIDSKNQDTKRKYLR